MKKTILSLALCLILPLFASQSLLAQKPVSEKKILGTWKLVIDLEKEFEEAEEELEDDDSILGELVLSSVSGLVEGVLERIDIYMQFRPDGELKVMVDAFGEKDTEYSEWKITKGKLYISDNEHFSTEEDDYWLLENDLLMLHENDDEKSENVYMVKVDN